MFDRSEKSALSTIILVFVWLGQAFKRIKEMQICFFFLYDVFH
jgi:hypothetical protein